MRKIRDPVQFGLYIIYRVQKTDLFSIKFNENILQVFCNCICVFLLFQLVQQIFPIYIVQTGFAEFSKQKLLIIRFFISFTQLELISMEFGLDMIKSLKCGFIINNQ